MVLGQRVANELGIGLGGTVTLLDHSATVVGILDQRVGFAAGEIWLPLATLQRVTGRPHVSKVVLQDGYDQATFLALSRPDLGMVEIAEEAYLATVTGSLAPLRVVAWIIAVLLIGAAAVGAGSAAVALADARRGPFCHRPQCWGVGTRLSLWFLGETAIRAVVALGLALFLLWPAQWHGAALGHGGARITYRWCSYFGYYYCRFYQQFIDCNSFITNLNTQYAQPTAASAVTYGV